MSSISEALPLVQVFNHLEGTVVAHAQCLGYSDMTHPPVADSEGGADSVCQAGGTLQQLLGSFHA
eukprot:1152488-Pelagomonas_calceolata.AAC.4